MSATTIIQRKFNPVPLMIILFTLSLTSLKLTEFNPLDFRPEWRFQNILFWIAAIGALLLFVTIFYKKLREWIAIEGTAAFIFICIAAYIINWLNFLSEAGNIFAGGAVVGYYILFGGLIYFFVLAFFACVRFGKNKIKRWLAFLLYLVAGCFLIFVQGNCYGGATVLLFSMSLLALAVANWTPPDYFPV